MAPRGSCRWALLLAWLPAGCLSLLVSVQDVERYTTLFATVILKCDYSTSAQLQDVVVTWRFKSFCKDPIFDYYSAWHVSRMVDHRLPKIVFYGEFATGCRQRRAPKRRYKDSLKQCLSLGHIDHHQWSTLASNREIWRHTIHNAAVSFESTRRISLEEKRQCRKNCASTVPPKETFRCALCNRSCLSSIGLFSHQCACTYQASLALGQDPSDNCNDSQRKVRIVIQKYGQKDPVLGIDYQQRKITIQNRADLVISEVMWWDHGVYYCTVEAPGDTSGDPDKEVKLIVLHWLTVLLIILSGLVLLLLIGVCWCQCCPQYCCCHVPCVCCPTRCCCNEEVLKRHRFMKQAQALAPWMSPNMFYRGGDRNSQFSSYQLNPLLQQDVSLQNSLPLVQPQAQLSPNKDVLDYLESELQNINMSQLRPPSHQRQTVQPSLLSSLGSEIMPPSLTDHISSIHGSSNSSRLQRAVHTSRPRDSAAEIRRENQRRLPSSGDSHSSYSREPWDRQQEDRPQRQRTGGYNGRPQHSRRDVSPPRQAERGKSSSSSCSFYPEEAKERSSHHHGWRQEPAERRDYEHHTRRSNNSGQRRHSYSPPSRRGSWSSSEEHVRLPATNRRRRDRSREWPEDKPPSYRSLEVIPSQEKKHKGSAGPRSDRGSSHSGRSIVI